MCTGRASARRACRPPTSTPTARPRSSRTPASWTDFWYVLRADGVGGYRQIWASDDYPDTIGSLRLAQLDADPALEIVVGVGGDILIYDGATHELQSSFATPASAVRGLTITDVDRDGMVEAVFCDDSWETNRLYVYDITSGVAGVRGRGSGRLRPRRRQRRRRPGPGDRDRQGTRARPRPEWQNARRRVDEPRRLRRLRSAGRSRRGRPGRGRGRPPMARHQHLRRGSPVSVGSIPVDYELDAVRCSTATGTVRSRSSTGTEGDHVPATARTRALEWEIANPDGRHGHRLLRLRRGRIARDVLWRHRGERQRPRPPVRREHLHRRAIEWQSHGLLRALLRARRTATSTPTADPSCSTAASARTAASGMASGSSTTPPRRRSSSRARPSLRLGQRGLWRRPSCERRRRSAAGDLRCRPWTPIQRPMIFCYDGLTHAEQWRVAL